MKIAYFTDTLTPQINGVTYVVETHAKLLSKNNHVTVFGPSYGLSGSTEKHGRLIIRRHPSVSVPNYKEMNISFINIPLMIKEVKDFNPDIIHFHSPANMGIFAIIIAKYLKIPLVTTYHTLWSETLPPLLPFNSLDKFFSDDDKERSILRKTIWKASKTIFDYCDVIISPADIIKKELIANNHKGKIVVISNGIDINKFKSRVRAKTNFRLLYVGRLSPEKKVDVVIRAFDKVKAFLKVVKRFNEAELIIVGDGKVKKDLKKLTKELKLSKKVKFIGSVDREKLVDYYKKCDLFVTASEMEVQPLTILEAMSCSLPIVGVNKAGVAGIVNNGINGYLADSANSQQIADKINAIFGDDKLRVKMAKASRKLAEENSLDESIKKLMKLYNQITRPSASK